MYHRANKTEQTNQLASRDLAPLGTFTLKVNLDNLETDQSFTVVENLSAPAILGCDFLKREGIVIDFQNNIFSSH